MKKHLIYFRSEQEKKKEEKQQKNTAHVDVLYIATGEHFLLFLSFVFTGGIL